MKFFKTDDISIGFTSVFMKLVGFWMAADRFEQRVRNFMLVYTLIALLFGVWIQVRDAYHSWGDFSAILFTACNILSTAMPFFKIIVLLVYKRDFFYLILYTRQKFLHGEYDEYEKTVLKGCKRKCTFFVCFLIFLTEATIICYVISPLIANIGRNESDRVLPFNMWIDLPLTITPYYEITFVLQVLSLYHIGISYFCFDNFLCIMNLHVASQFRILNYRMANVKRESRKDEKLSSGSSSFARKCYALFKKYVREHQALIAYCDKLEKVFNIIVLGQVLMFSLLICLDGYQILMPEAPIRKRLIFTFHLSACLCQLLMFSYSCDCIIRESMNIASAVYKGPWTLLPTTTSGRMMRKDLILVIMRSSVPCCLTAKKFFIVSLETYTSVLSTAMSYFTLLKQTSEE